MYSLDSLYPAELSSTCQCKCNLHQKKQFSKTLISNITMFECVSCTRHEKHAWKLKGLRRCTRVYTPVCTHSSIGSGRVPRVLTLVLPTAVEAPTAVNILATRYRYRIQKSKSTRVHMINTSTAVYPVDLISIQISALLYGTGYSPWEKKTFYRQVLKLRLNEASAQGLQNAV
jgi:hypothetical protein